LKHAPWLALALALAGIAILPASAQQRLDGIAAVVNNEVVLQSDVEEQLYLFLLRSGARPDSSVVDTLRRQILDQLIDEKLIVAEAKRLNVTVADAEVSRQVDEAVREAKQRMGGEQGFSTQLQRENMTEAKLREKYQADTRRQMLAERLVRKQVARKIVSAAEAETFFKANAHKFPKAPPELRLAVIQIPADPDSAAAARARAQAIAARKRIAGGEKFAKVAAEVSDDQGSARSGGDLGFIGRGAVEPALERALFEQKIGVLGEPVRSSFGWHIVEVLERDTVKTRAGRDSLDAQGVPALESHGRHVAVRVELKEADVERARKLADKVHAEALKGTEFATLAKRYSKFEGPAAPDGEIGWLSIGTLQPNIRAGLDTVPVGRISDVLVNRAGFNIFKVLERKPERMFTLEEIRDDLPEAVAQIQFREKYEAWVKALRAKAHIEIRS
jgi:peptidyl-prolyl cis-trans isomerase SurA